jgi:dUTP pyrophosphatase
MVVIKVFALKHFDPSFGLPSFQTTGAAGVDVRASLEDKLNLVISPGQRVLIPTGLVLEIPEGFEIQVRPRSGLSLKTKLILPNSPGTIDADYRGEVKVIMANLGSDDFIIHHGDRIAQWVLSIVPQVQYQWAQELSLTERGNAGFGSTGVNLIKSD